MNELKKCPFCGGEAKIRSTRSWHFLESEHDSDCIFEADCAIQVPASSEQRELLVRDWNRRANSDLRPEVTELGNAK